MGQICPKCKTHKAVKAVHTANGTPPVHPEDIIITVLECGHTFGGPEFEEYTKALAALTIQHNQSIQDLKQDHADAVGAAWEQLRAKHEASRNK